MFLCGPNWGDRSLWYGHDSYTVRRTLIGAGLTGQEAYNLWEEGPREVYFFIEEHPDMVFSEWLVSIVKPKPTLLNKVGNFFSAGTDCTCCLGWRIALAVGLLPLSFYLGAIYA